MNQTTGIVIRVARVDRRHHLGSWNLGVPPLFALTGFLGGGRFGGGSVDAGELRGGGVDPDGRWAVCGADGCDVGDFARRGLLAFGSNSQS